MNKIVVTLSALLSMHIHAASYMPTMKIQNQTGKKVYFALSHDKSIPSIHTMTKNLAPLPPGQEVDFFAEDIDPSSDVYLLLHTKKTVTKKDTFSLYKFLTKKPGRNGKIEHPHFIYINVQLDENNDIKVVPQSSPYAQAESEKNAMNNVIDADRIKVNRIRYASLPKLAKL